MEGRRPCSRFMQMLGMANCVVQRCRRRCRKVSIDSDAPSVAVEYVMREKDSSDGE